MIGLYSDTQRLEVLIFYIVYFLQMSINKFFKIVLPPDSEKNLSLLNDLGIYFHGSPSWSLLMYAIQAKKIELVKFLVNNGACINKARGSNDDFPLLVAANTADSSIIKFLMEKGANISQQSLHGWTPLHKICKSSNLDVVELFVQKGAAILAQTAEGNTPLHIACRSRKSVGRVCFLIKEGSSLEIKNEKGQTPLHVASMYGNYEGASVLIKNGAELFSIDREGRTPYIILKPQKPQKRYYPVTELIISEVAFQHFMDPTIISQNDVKFIEGHEFHHRYYQNCKSELNEMQKMIIHSSFSYFSVLKMYKNIYQLACLTKNKDFIEKYELNVTKIHYYEKKIKAIMNEALQLRDKLLSQESTLYYIFGKTFPNIIIKKLSRNLCFGNQLM